VNTQTSEYAHKSRQSEGKDKSRQSEGRVTPPVSWPFNALRISTKSHSAITPAASRPRPSAHQEAPDVVVLWRDKPWSSPFAEIRGPTSRTASAPHSTRNSIVVQIWEDAGKEQIPCQTLVVIQSFVWKR